MSELDPWWAEDVETLINSGDLEELARLPIELTNAGSHDPAWSQAVCVRLAVHPDAGVRGNAVLGLGHLARSMRELDREPCHAIVVAALNDPDRYVAAHARSAADDIAQFLRWPMP